MDGLACCTSMQCLSMSSQYVSHHAHPCQELAFAADPGTVQEALLEMHTIQTVVLGTLDTALCYTWRIVKGSLGSRRWRGARCIQLQSMLSGMLTASMAPAARLCLLPLPILGTSYGTLWRLATQRQPRFLKPQWRER
jgi:hypothetical protein